MVIVYGESSSGKSTKVLNMLDPDKKVLYFALDFDRRIKSLELRNPNLQVTAYPNRKTYLSDITSEILNHGGFYNNKLSFVVIDPINLLSDNKKNLLEFILKIKELEKQFNKFEMIAVLNKLALFSLNKEIFNLPEITYINSARIAT